MSIAAMKVALKLIELGETAKAQHILAQSIKDEEKDEFNPDYDTRAVLLDRVMELEATVAEFDELVERAQGLEKKACEIIQRAEQKPWVGLTFGESNELWGEYCSIPWGELVHAIEEKLKEKNNG